MTMEEAVRLDNNRRICKHKETQSLLDLLEDVKTFLEAEKRGNEE